MRGRRAEGGRRTFGLERFLSALCPLLSALLLFGCGGPGRLAPLTVGQKWDFRFRRGVERDVGQIEVVREVPLASGTGWELRGPMGVARLGYAGDRLVADELGGAFLTPPLPIGLPAKGRAQWRGWVVSPEGRQPAKATAFADVQPLKVQGQERKLDRTVVSMRVGGHAVELTTWFVPGDGIVQQEQRTDDKLNLSMERVSGG